MDAEEQRQASSEVELNDGDVEQRLCALNDEGQLIVFPLSLCGQNPLDSSPNVEDAVEEPDPAKKRPTKKRSWKRKHEIKPLISENPRRCRRLKRKREIVVNKVDYLKARASRVMERAEEIRASLSPQCPGLIKLMRRSHVTVGFWLGLPSEFCRLHLPGHDETVVLVDESGEEYKTNFLVDKTGLSGGWRGFTVAKNLLEGDALVFHLISPCKFKVYIVRAKDFDYPEKDGTGEVEISHDSVIQRNEEDSMLVTSIYCGPIMDQSESNRDEVECFMLSRSIADYKNFKITVNGFSVDAELPRYLRAKYYDLCCTQKSCLHSHFLSSINSKLAAGIISETVNIADSIRSCNISSSRDDFAIWAKTLQAFELLGMDVGFLRARLNRLVNLASDSENAAASKRYEQARIERDHAEEEMKNLELKLSKLKQAKDSLESEMKGLMVNAQRYEIMFQEEATAPWG